MSDLSKILEESRPAIEAALAEAEQELAQLDQRRHELEALIARARAAIGDPQPTPEAGGPVRLTLHNAMRLVLEEHHNQWMTVRQLAEEINRRGLYEKRDRTPMDPSQIHARANKYPRMFEKNGADVRLSR
jgi:hypothetical protein